MTSNTVIAVENVGKKYYLNHRSLQRNMTLRDAICLKLAAPQRWIADGAERLRRSLSNTRQCAPNSEEFWALSDVSFTINRGEVVGIIGRNGAGKSTLLKILSRITVPTSGVVRLRGTMGSLLEIGTGFHPELTGRENIFLNGTILGMSRRDIRNRFDAIVAFADVDKFLDTPVKRYSSGMYVRLAFSVAAHLESDVLVVDEVLAVGDVEFQRKCLAKIEEVGKSGMTVLFVTHNMATLQSLCRRTLVLENGRLIADEQSADAIHRYLRLSSGSDSFRRAKQRSGVPTVIYGDLSEEDPGSACFTIGLFIHTEELRRVAIDIRLKDGSGVPVGLGSYGAMCPADMIELKPMVNRLSFKLETYHLATGRYVISIDVTLPGAEYYDRVENCLSFELQRSPKLGALYALPQAWNYGCVELPLTHLRVTAGLDAKSWLDFARSGAVCADVISPVPAQAVTLAPSTET